MHFTELHMGTSTSIMLRIGHAHAQGIACDSLTGIIKAQVCDLSVTIPTNMNNCYEIW